MKKPDGSPLPTSAENAEAERQEKLRQQQRADQQQQRAEQAEQEVARLRLLLQQQPPRTNGTSA